MSDSSNLKEIRLVFVNKGTSHGILLQNLSSGSSTGFTGHVKRHFYSILLRNYNRYHVFPLLLEMTVLSYIPLGNCALLSPEFLMLITSL